MVTVMEAVSPRIAQYARFINVILCTWIHNPLLACGAILTARFGLLTLQLIKSSSQLFSHVNVDEYALDFLHNIINLLFVLRFPAAAKDGLSIVSSNWSEAILLVLQNLGCVALLWCPEYSLLHSKIHPVLKGFMLWQIVCPYLILALSVVEMKRGQNYSEKMALLPRKLLTGSLLVDTNNNLLPIFMAHSFAAANFSFPFAPVWLVITYKVACFSLKFYLINRYVLYELVVVISDVSTLKQYSDLYMPVMIGERPKGWYESISRHMTTILTAVCVTLMGVDVGFMAVGLMA